jgi:hypothetical protein
MPKMSVRNREIFSALQDGQSLDKVARLYGLKPGRVSAILQEERLKRRYSLEEAYRSLRLPARLPGKG